MIVYLYLPPHSTHLLHSLDVNVFNPLKQNYKIPLAKKTRFSTYNIGKANFISFIQKARRQRISSQNIESGLQTTELITFNHSLYFKS